VRRSYEPVRRRRGCRPRGHREPRPRRALEGRPPGEPPPVRALLKNAQKFIAHTIARSSHILTKALNKTSLTTELLGTGDEHGEFKAYVEKPTTKPETVTLATMITAYEANIDRTSWRNPYSDNRYYLTQLTAWG
jgi:ParB family chromosome partitioning protein